MKSPQNSEAHQLLEAFVASNRSESAFRALVGNLSSLAYAGALRRTRDPQLAEEITQNVFALLAQRAKSLRSHPSLLAWIHETTRLQCATAMRAERRRQRKAAALANEINTRDAMSMHPSDHTSEWQDALPVLDEALDRLPERDRQLVFERFYEGRKFKDIARRSGQSEASCKMRLKRALVKMSTLLKARGVTLSVTALATGLGAELTRAVSAQTIATLSTQALAASSSLPTTTVVANILQTMSSAKTSALTSAAVLAIAAIPFAQQRAEARKLQSQILQVESRDSRPARKGLKSQRPAKSPSTSTVGGRTASSLLVSLTKPMGPRDVLRDLCSWSYLSREMARQRVTQMTDDEYAELMEELGSFPCGPDTYRSLSEFLLKRPSGSSPDKMLDWLISAGEYQASTAGGTPDKNPLTKWAKKDPAAAVQWYEQKLAGDELMTGLGDQLFADLYLHLMPGLIESAPDLALDLYARTPKDLRDFRSGMFWPTLQLAGVYGKELAERGNEAGVRRLLDLAEPPAEQLIVSSTAQAYARAGKLDEGLAFVDQHMPERWDPRAYPSRGYDTSVYNKREDYVNTMAGTASSEVGLGEGLDWFLANESRQEAAAQIVMQAFSGFGDEKAEAMQWLERQESGLLRDAAHAQLVWEMTKNADYDGAMEATPNIDDPSIRSQMETIIEDSRQLYQDTEGRSRVRSSLSTPKLKF